jgi:hypothetical protein
VLTGNSGVIAANTVNVRGGVNGITNPNVPTIQPGSTAVNAPHNTSTTQTGGSTAPAQSSLTINNQNIALPTGSVGGNTGQGQGGNGRGGRFGLSNTNNAATLDTASNTSAGTTNVNTIVNATKPGLTGTGATLGNVNPNGINTTAITGPNGVNAIGTNALNNAVNLNNANQSVASGTVSLGPINGSVTGALINAGSAIAAASANTGNTGTPTITAGTTAPTVNTNGVTTLPVDANIDPQIISGVNRLNDLITSAETLNQNLPFQPIPVAAINAANVSGLSLNANVANALINAPATAIHSTVNPTGVTGTGFTNQRRETSTRLAAINPIERNGIDDTSDPAGPPTNQQVGNPNKDNEPITNLTNLLDLKVPPGTIQGTTVNILGDFRNTGFVFAENINIANTVENLINERRLANPGTVEFEAGGGNWVFERGQRAQPGGFMSAVNWNIDAQHIQSIGGTFEFKGMTDAQTAQFTSFLRAQLQSMYGNQRGARDMNGI